MIAEILLQQGAPPSPFWMEVVKTLAGPLIGAAFVVVGIWLKEVYDRRKASQTWFEQYYITEGLDQFIAHLHSLALATISVIQPNLSLPAENLPHSVLTRMLSLLGNSDFLGMPIYLRSFLKEWDNKQEGSDDVSPRLDKTLDAIDSMTDILEKLRRRLLVISITSKTDVYKLRDDAEIVSTLKEANNNFEEWLSAVETSQGLKEAVESPDGNASTEVNS